MQRWRKFMAGQTLAHAGGVVNRTDLPVSWARVSYRPRPPNNSVKETDDARGEHHGERLERSRNDGAALPAADPDGPGTGDVRRADDGRSAGAEEARDEEQEDGKEEESHEGEEEGEEGKSEEVGEEGQEGEEGQAPPLEHLDDYVRERVSKSASHLFETLPRHSAYRIDLHPIGRFQHHLLQRVLNGRRAQRWTPREHHEAGVARAMLEGTLCPHPLERPTCEVSSPCRY